MNADWLLFFPIISAVTAHKRSGDATNEKRQPLKFKNKKALQAPLSLPTLRAPQPTGGARWICEMEGLWQV